MISLRIFKKFSVSVFSFQKINIKKPKINFWAFLYTETATVKFIPQTTPILLSNALLDGKCLLDDLDLDLIYVRL